jgi:hypothetical protein
MFIEDLAVLLQLYTDEPDQTVESDALMARQLQLAYSDFRGMVCELDPTIYSVTYDATVGGADTLNLNGVLFGAAPTQPRLDTLLDITVLQGGREAVRWRAGTTIDDVIHGNADYVLIGTALKMPSPSSSSIRIHYMPTQGLTLAQWTAGLVAGTNVFIDDLYRFHDMIPLLAYLQYAVLDAADHAQLLMLLHRRQKQLKTYLQSRGGPGADEVVDSRWMES